MSDDFENVTTDLGISYRLAKEADKRKSESRSKFFELINEQENEEPTEFVFVKASSELEAVFRINKYRPAHRVVNSREVDGGYEFELQIDSKYRTFTYVNPSDGMVYSRQARSGSLHIDEERLRDENPELYERVTYVPQEPVLRDLDEIEDEDAAELAEYMYSEAPTMRLAPPRKAKPEELGE